MANIIKDFLGYLKLGEDDDFDEFLDEEDEPERRPKRKDIERQERQQSRTEKAESAAGKKNESDSPVSAFENKRDRLSRVPEKEKAPNKVVPIRTTPKGMEVCIMKPTNFEDSQEICDMLLTGRAAVVNLEGFDPVEAQRIMDFISGAVYAINGKLHQISRYIFIFSPDTIDISGDYLGFIAEDSFEVPTLNKEF